MALCEGHNSQHYKNALSRPLRQKRSINRSRERPLPASRWREAYMLSVPVENGGTTGKMDRSSSPMTPVRFSRLRLRVSTEPALPDSGLSLPIPLRKKGCESGRVESFKRVTAVLAPGSEKEYGLKKWALLKSRGHKDRQV